MSAVVGSVWRINGSGNEFEVEAIEAQYATVCDRPFPARRRRILLAALRSSSAKSGYTLVSTPAVTS